MASSSPVSISEQQETAAINFVLALQAKQTPLDHNNARTALTKPVLLDNPSHLLSVAQINRKNAERREVHRRQLLLKRSLRRSKLEPIKSEELEKELFGIWKAHYGVEQTRSASELAGKIDLRGCFLTVSKSKSMLLPKNQTIEGIVIRESQDVIHLSSCVNKKVFCVKKRGTIFSCEGVEFERLRWSK